MGQRQRPSRATLLRLSRWFAFWERNLDLRLANILIVAFFVLCFAESAVASPLRVLRYGEAFSALQSIYSLPIFVADREGFFKKEGLAVTNVLVPGGGGKMIRALDRGKVDLTHVAVPFLIKEAMNGSDAVAIAAEFDNPIYSLIAKPGIDSFMALKGKVIGMADERGTISYSIWKLLAMHGVGQGEVSVRTLSGTPQRLLCLEHGPCDAVPLGQPEDFMAIDKGYKLLGRSTEAVPSFLYTVTAARRSWAAAHKDEIVRYIRALAASFRYIRNPAHRRQLVGIIVDTEGVTRKSARQTLALYFDHHTGVLPKAGEIKLSALRQVISFMTATGALKKPAPDARRFVDLDFLHAAGIR